MKGGKIRVLITGVGGTASQNFIRSLRLSNEKFHLVGTDTNKYHLTCADVEEKHLIASAYSPNYIPQLFQIIKDTKVDFVHCQPDIEVAKLAEYKVDIPSKVFLPSLETIIKCQNKLTTNSILKKANVPVPESYTINALEELTSLFKKLSVESNKKVWVRAIKGAGSRAALPVTSSRQAIEWISYWRANRQLDSSDFMISEFLPGREFAFQSIWKNGQLITSMARERLEYLFGNLMPSGQSSSPSVARTVHNNDVNKTAIKAIKAIDRKANGIFCVDLKENNKGKPCVTEINAGRFFTTNDFFSHAGVNMPLYYVYLGLGKRIPKLKKINCLPKNLYWIRGVDREAKLLNGKHFEE